MDDIKYSFIIPCYKSSQTITNVIELTIEEIRQMNNENFEFILVNDCSPDHNETINVLKKLAEKYSFVKVIDLAINTGQHNAIMAGLNYAEGEIMIGMDDDGQTHPSQLTKLFSELEKGYDIVYGYYPEKKHNIFRRIGSFFNQLSVKILVKKPNHLKTSSYWVIKRFIRDNIIKYESSHTYLQGLFLRTTKNIASVSIEHFEREYGTSNYNFKTLLKLWSNIIGFSVVPLRLSTYLGYLFALGGFAGGIFVFIQKLRKPHMAMGWPSTMVAIFIFSGLILLFLGLIGEYTGRMFLAQNREPQYVVKEKINFDEGEEKR